MARGNVPKHLRLATDQQLWRLNEQGALALIADESSYQPGAPAAGPPILNGQADQALRSLVHGRWAGMERWPLKGESWRVVDGRVQSLGVVDEEDSRT